MRPRLEAVKATCALAHWLLNRRRFRLADFVWFGLCRPLRDRTTLLADGRAWVRRPYADEEKSE